MFVFIYQYSYQTQSINNYLIFVLFYQINSNHLNKNIASFMQNYSHKYTHLINIPPFLSFLFFSKPLSIKNLYQSSLYCSYINNINKPAKQYNVDECHQHRFISKNNFIHCDSIIQSKIIQKVHLHWFSLPIKNYLFDQLNSIAYFRIKFPKYWSQIKGIHAII